MNDRIKKKIRELLEKRALNHEVNRRKLSKGNTLREYHEGKKLECLALIDEIDELLETIDIP